MISIKLGLLPPQRKLELECRLEEEKMRTESEQKDLKMGVVQLETKLKHITEHSKSELGRGSVWLG